MDFPTPTAYPISEATPALVNAIDPAQFTETIAHTSVSWWQTLNDGGLLTLVQLTILIIIIVAGITLITKAINTDV